MGKFSLVVDPNKNPLNLVLGNWDVVDGYARYIQPKVPQWGSMRVPERAKFLTDFPQDVLNDLEIAPPAHLGFTESMGAFEGAKWRILLVRSYFAGDDPNGVAEQAGHVMHEYEHLASTYVAGRYLAAQLIADPKQKDAGPGAIQSRLGILKEIASDIFAHPLPANLEDLGKACLFRVTSEKGTGGKDGYYENLHANIRKSEAEVDMARAEIDKLTGSSPSSKNDLFKAWTREKKAVGSLKSALREYELSETEIGSNAVEQQVKSRVLRLLAAGQR